MTREQRIQEHRTPPPKPGTAAFAWPDASKVRRVRVDEPGDASTSYAAQQYRARQMSKAAQADREREGATE
jgi:hypothetical protein